MRTAVEKQPNWRTTFVVGLIAAAAGLYYLLAASGVLPLPGGKQSIQGPAWLLFCAGLIFFFGGVAVVLRSATGTGDEEGDLARSAPFWIRLAYFLMGLVIVSALASIGTWVAFGPGERKFTMVLPFLVDPHANQYLGRAVFGVGAVLTWLFAIALLLSGSRKLFGPDRA